MTDAELQQARAEKWHLDGRPVRTLDEARLHERARDLRAQGYSVRDTATELAREFTAPRNLAYRVAKDAT